MTLKIFENTLKPKALIVILSLLTLISNGITCQVKNDSLLTVLKNSRQSDSTKANLYRKLIYKEYIGSKIDSAYAMALDLIDFTKEHKLDKQRADALILLGDIQHVFGNNTEAIKSLKESLDLYTELNDKRGIASVLNGIGTSYRKIYNLDEAKFYFDKSLKLSQELNDTILMSKVLINIGNIYGWRFKSDLALKYYNQSLELSRASNNKKEEAVAIINLASSYNQKKQYDLSKLEIGKAKKIGKELQDYNILANSYKVLSGTYFRQKQYDSLIISANKMLNYAEKISLRNEIDGAYYFLFEAYKGKKDFDNTIKYYDLRRNQRTTIDDITSVNILEKMKIDNHRAKDSLINVNKDLKTKINHQKEKTNLTLAWAGSLSALSIVAFLIFRNTKQKQRKAEKERQEQIEEKEKILKELELSTIDAMIAGQEKERQRLAADLHDSVGATLAAAKLQFNYLIKNQNDAKYSEELIKKTSSLLEDAYVEIRSMAHLKNSGVMAKNGLLPAIEKLTENASGINDIKFEIQSFGLEQRLENSLEISVFRIVQELVTNIIKHANATQGTVHLTNHNNSLNIMVEDNGVGFDPKKTMKTKKGMGISSIDKRVNHLEGKFNIESRKNQGTTVIIDIPL